MKLGRGSPIMPLMIMQCFTDQKIMLILLKYHIWLIWPQGATGHMAMDLVVHRASKST